MDEDVIGFVFHATKYANGNVDVSFYDKNKGSTVTYSTTKSKGSQLTRELAQTLVNTIAHNIWVKIHFSKKRIATGVSLEEYDFEKDAYGLKEKLGRRVKVGR